MAVVRIERSGEEHQIASAQLRTLFEAAIKKQGHTHIAEFGVCVRSVGELGEDFRSVYIALKPNDDVTHVLRHERATHAASNWVVQLRTVHDMRKQVPEPRWPRVRKWLDAHL